MYDEDFPGARVYSNTVQSNNRGSLGYGTIDVGYNFWTAPGAKVGYFVGYNYYQQHSDTFGCRQQAADAVCVPTGVIPSTFNGISEDDSFSSVRIGISARFARPPTARQAQAAALWCAQQRSQGATP